METFPEDHFRHDIHGQALESCIKIDWGVFARQFVEFLAEVLNPILQHRGYRLHSTDREEWAEHLAPYPMQMQIGQAYRRAGERDATVECRLFGEFRRDPSGLLEVTGRVDVQFIDTDPYYRT